MVIVTEPLAVPPVSANVFADTCETETIAGLLLVAVNGPATFASAMEKVVGCPFAFGRLTLPDITVKLSAGAALGDGVGDGVGLAVATGAGVGLAVTIGDAVGL